MKILATGDLHGHLPDVPRCDLLLLAGDILPDEKQDLWSLQEFRPWIKSLRARRVVFIAGNHDFYFETPAWKEGGFGARYFEELGATYLEDSDASIGSLRIWGTPWVEGLAGWAFAKEDAKEDFARIPLRTDLLLTHSPPRGVLDDVLGQNVGSASLASRLQRVAPRWHIFGHIHERGGEDVQLGGTHFYNVSQMNGSFHPVHDAQVVEQ